MNTISILNLTKREITRFFSTINQTLFPPIISSLLFLAIFNFVIGTQQGSDGFLQFLVPGLVMMAIVNNAFSDTSFSLFLAKWTHYFQMILTLPLTYFELVLAYNLGSMVRGFITGAGIMLAISFFVPLTFHSIFLMILYTVMAIILFASLGILVALWAKHFEHLGIIMTFFLTPLTMLGGVFYSIALLPPLFQKLTLLNPIFYLVDGFRFAMLGTHDAPIWLGILVSSILAITAFTTVTILMRNGWKVKQ